MPNIIETTDAAASTATAYTLVIGETAQGVLGSNSDQDWWRVQLVAGQTYTFALVGSGGSQVDDTYLYLRNAAGTVIVENDDGGPGTNSSITFTASTSGAYFLDAGSFNNAGAGQYGLSAVIGSRAHYDEQMGAGNLFRDGASCSATPGTPVNVTWSVSSSNASQTDASNNPTTFIAPSAAQVTAMQAALAQYSEVGGITFTQVNPGGTSNNATIRLNAYNSTTDGAGAYAYFPGDTAANDTDGDVNLNNNSVSTSSLPQGSYSFFAILHEVGHAMGLAHPGDYNAAPGVNIEYNTHAQFTEDSHQYTVMSYFDESNTTDDYNSYPDTLMMFDILAVQQLYGINYSTRAGNSIYGFGANTGATYDFSININPALCIWDGGGIDTLNASGFSQSQLLDLRAGTFSDIGGVAGNVSIAIGAVIENAVGGSGADMLVGNAANNVLDGGAGADTMRGGTGNDTYYVDNTGDVVTELTGEGTDLVRSSVTFALSQFVENLTLTGTAAINATGNGLANALNGNSGNNWLDGQAGADTMIGGLGNDVYFVDNAGDIVQELANQGNDVVWSTVSYSLTGTQAEKLSLFDGGNFNATGNGLANALKGNSGNNWLDGQAGADTMIGGLGNDVYFVDNAGDIVQELANQGNDVVWSTVSYSLTGSQAEKLSLFDGGNFNATGNGLANALNGNTGNNILNGLGAADTLTGGAGNDIFQFTTTLGAGNIDRIADFNVAADTIQLDNAIMAALGATGVLTAGQLRINTTGAAQDADDHIIYNSSTGALFYDSNGNAAGGAQQIATLTAGLALTNADFVVI